MKPYFAKYLPEEGEIEKGDFYVTAPDYKNIRKCEDKSWGTFEMCKKVKLFLCSRDIQVGDKIYLSQSKKTEIFKYQRPDGRIICESGDEKEYPKELAKQEFFKVIGEILTRGIIENKEFTEKEVEFLTIGEKFT